MHLSSVTVEEAKLHMDEPDVVLVDVRSVEEFNESHVEGSVNMPLEDVLNRVKELQNYTTVYMLCRSGARSGYAAELLRSMGIPAVNITGGLLAWHIQ